MSEIDIDKGVSLLLDRYEKCSKSDITYGRHWYMQAHDFAQTLSVKYGCTLRQAAGVLATLSPRNKWKDNKIDAENVIKAWSEDKGLQFVKLSTPYVKIDKCIKILRQNIDPDTILVQKSRSFYRCIYYPLTKEVCVDVWAARALEYTERWIPYKVYPDLQKCYQIAAEKLNLIPHVLQAIIWVNIRGKHD